MPDRVKKNQKQRFDAEGLLGFQFKDDPEDVKQTT